jgi:hypothetical protein
VIDRLKGGLLGFAWLAIALVIAAGAAGLVAGADHFPGTDARPELTWARDAAANASLETAEGDLAALSGQVDELGVQARGALAAIIGGEIETAEAAIARGDQLVADIDIDGAVIREFLATVPGVAGPDAPLTVSAAVRGRHDRLVRALAATEALEGAWARLTAGSRAAIGLDRLLGDHDRLIAEAASLGRLAEYDAAAKRVGEAAAVLAQAATVRDQLANSVDVTVLREWISRNGAYDTALRELYEKLLASRGRATAAVTAAIAKEEAAKKRLPPDARGLVVIMAAIAQGGMNGAVTTIEDARGELAAALASGTSPGTPEENGGPTPPP